MKISKIILLFIISTFISKNISALSKLRVCTEQSPPFTESNRDTGDLKGIDVDIFKLIIDKLEINYKLEEMPWARCQLSMQAGIVDIALQISKNPDREKFLYYPETSVWDSEFVFFTNLETKKKYKINNYDDAKKEKLKIGVINENSYNPDFWKSFPWVDKPNQIYNPQLEPSVNVETNLKKLDLNIIQLYPQDKLVGIYTKNKLHLKHITYYNSIIFKKPYYNAFSKVSKFSSEKYNNIFELIDKYNTELKKFKKTKNYNAIFDKYLRK
jgi:polar amino acid transport system substrate-binding protein